MKQIGRVRVEVHIRKEDADLIRIVARALADPLHHAETRALLKRLPARKPVGLKALLAAAPLDGIDLDRAPDKGREIDL
jgi:hypothetical protein